MEKREYNIILTKSVVVEAVDEEEALIEGEKTNWEDVEEAIMVEERW
jgi:hypothetical protein